MNNSPTSPVVTGQAELSKHPQECQARRAYRDALFADPVDGSGNFVLSYAAALVSDELVERLVKLWVRRGFSVFTCGTERNSLRRIKSLRDGQVWICWASGETLHVFGRRSARALQQRSYAAALFAEPVDGAGYFVMNYAAVSVCQELVATLKNLWVGRGFSVFTCGTEKDPLRRRREIKDGQVWICWSEGEPLHVFGYGLSMPPQS